MRKYDLVCFDMDGTLTKLRSSWCWVHEHYGVDNEPAYQAFVNGEIDEPEFMRRDIALWKGVDPDVTVNDIALTFRDMPLIEGIQETIACLNDCHIRAVIVSGGIDLAAAMLTREFGFDDYVADELCAYEDGRLTGFVDIVVEEGLELLQLEGICVFRGFEARHGSREVASALVEGEFVGYVSCRRLPFEAQTLEFVGIQQQHADAQTVFRRFQLLNVGRTSVA